MKRQRLFANDRVGCLTVSTAIVVSLALTACAGANDVASTTAAPTAVTTVVPTTTTSPATTSQPATTVAPTSTTTTVPTTSTTVVLSEEAQAAQGIIDRWIAAWNAGDEQAVREQFSPDFSYNDTAGQEWVDGALDRFVGFIDQYPELIRASEAVEGEESGAFTWVIEVWGTASTRYPAEVLDMEVTFDNATIRFIDEQWHRDG